ncbi:hypothetical protein [uncultured Campylobacter sp.]|uniref:hypothetical protein n=1 Tax=uncultured Campylobacter sp. TaxID=218934 RepID=UPI00261B1EAA|nr:hypothetical protein [uncultured Campylobacter sp.]
MRGVFKISPEGAADFAALNLKARAIISAGAFRARTAVNSRARTAVLAGFILAATLALAMPVGAAETGETHETASNFKARTDKICLQKTSYKTEGGAVPRYEYEVSQNYDAKTRRLEKIYKKSGEEGVSVSKSFSKFDESGEREIENVEYDWDANTNKLRETAMSKQEIAADGSKIYFSLQSKDGKPYEGEKAVEKREGKTEILQNFTLKKGRWTPTHLTKRIVDENDRNNFVATYEWNAKAKKWMPYEKSIYHYNGDVYAGSEGYAWRGKWVPLTKHTVFTAGDGTRSEINFIWKDDTWQRDEKILRKIEPKHRRFTELRSRWDAAKNEWREYYKNVHEETEESRPLREQTVLWREELQRWEVVFENEFSYDARGNVIKNRQVSNGKQYEYIYDYDEAGNNISITLREPDESGKWHETQKTQNVFEPEILAHDVLDRGFIGDYIAAGKNAIKSSKQYFLKDGEFKLNETREWVYGKCEPQ